MASSALPRFRLAAFFAALLVAFAPAPAFADDDDDDGDRKHWRVDRYHGVWEGRHWDDRRWDDRRHHRWDDRRRGDWNDRDYRQGYRDGRRAERWDERRDRRWDDGARYDRHGRVIVIDRHRGPSWHHGRGHGPPRWARGHRIHDYGWAPTYVLVDYGRHGLYHPPRGHHWRRDDVGNLLLVAIATGLIADVVLYR